MELEEARNNSGNVMDQTVEIMVAPVICASDRSIRFGLEDLGDPGLQIAVRRHATAREGHALWVGIACRAWNRMKAASFEPLPVDRMGPYESPDRATWHTGAADVPVVMENFLNYGASEK